MINEDDLDRLFGSSSDELRSYYEYNREDNSAIHLDEKENAIDSLETAAEFFSRNDNLKWKWIAMSLHHSLYSFAISSLEHGNYTQVLSKGYEDDKDIYVAFGDNKPRKSRVVPFFIKKYKTRAYRIEWDEVESIPKKNVSSKSKKKKSEKLITFWTALARIQDNFFWMRRYCLTKAAVVSDEDLYKLCWLSDMVRNDLMHFVPKSYAIGIIDIIEASKVILNIIEFIVFESYAILFVDYERSHRRIRDTIDKIKSKLNEEENKLIKL